MVLVSLVGGIGVGSFLAAVIAQLNGRDRRLDPSTASDTHFHTKGFQADGRGRKKMDGGKKRDTEYGTRM